MGLDDENLLAGVTCETCNDTDAVAEIEDAKVTVWIDPHTRSLVDDHVIVMQRFLWCVTCGNSIHDKRIENENRRVLNEAARENIPSVLNRHNLL